jgi:hypothetical protein
VVTPEDQFIERLGGDVEGFIDLGWRAGLPE